MCIRDSNCIVHNIRKALITRQGEMAYFMQHIIKNEKMLRSPTSLFQTGMLSSVKLSNASLTDLQNLQLLMTYFVIYH